MQRLRKIGIPFWPFSISPMLSALLLALTCANLNCTKANVLSEFAKKDTNEALLKAAKIHIDHSEWTEAIAEFSSMSADYLASREVTVVLASAYAGRCGLNLLALAEGISGTLSSLLFKFLMQQYPGALTTNRDDCKTAETLIRGISPDATSRTTDENFLMVFLSFAKIGVTLSAHADKTTIDGEPDGGWNACTDDASNFPETSVREVGTGLANALLSLTAIGGAVGGSQLTSFTDVCADLETINPAFNFCSTTDASSFTALHVQAIRSLVSANEFVGIGSCNDTLGNCLCP